MKKNIIFILLITITALATLLIFFYGKQFIIRVSETELRMKLAEKLPITKTYLVIFNITLSNPRVDLMNGSDRINSGLDITLDINLLNEISTFNGSVDISGGLRYNHETGEFFVTDPQVEKLSIKGIPEKYTDKINLVISKALNQYYQSRPIYILKPTDIKKTAARLVLKKVMVENEHLVITLGL